MQSTKWTSAFERFWVWTILIIYFIFKHVLFPFFHPLPPPFFPFLIWLFPIFDMVFNMVFNIIFLNGYDLLSINSVFSKCTSRANCVFSRLSFPVGLIQSHFKHIQNSRTTKLVTKTPQYMCELSQTQLK